jgi:hypothetical protein
MSAASEAETAARKANDSKAASEAFRNSQQEIHTFLNSAKNASMYVDFKQGKFVAPGDVVDEESALAMAAVAYYFMSVTGPRLAPLRRMLHEPELHSEMMSGLSDALTNMLAGSGTIEEREVALNEAIKETAARIAAAKQRDREEQTKD